jgi:hypothetical protein
MQINNNIDILRLAGTKKNNKNIGLYGYYTYISTSRTWLDYVADVAD